MQLPGLNAGDYLEHNIGFAVGSGIAVGGGAQTIKMVATSTGFSVTGTLAVSGVHTFANGTAAAPSIAFTNSTGTGFYRSAADTIGYALGGVPGLAIAASAPTLAAATDTAGSDVYLQLASGGATPTVARNGGSANFTAGTGSTGALAIAGGAGGNFVTRGGAGGGTVTGSAGAGGAGGIRGGDGGAASGAGVGGAGGPATLRPGVGGTTSGGTAGVNGIAMVAGAAPMPFAENQVYTAKTDADATLTAAEHRGGIVSVATGANNRSITTLTAAQLVAAFPGVQVGSSVPLEMLNLKAANTVTMIGGANVTGVGNLVVAANAAVKFKIFFTNVTASSEAAQLIRVAG